MNNKPFHAPVKNPKRILDIGCGTGVLTVRLGREFPEAEVIGVDISPVPQRHAKPDNVTFVEGNIMELAKGDDPRFQLGSFDYVFHRLLIFGVTDWPAYVRAVQSLLSPGGWAEMQDLDLDLMNENGDSLAEAWWFYKIFNEDCKAIGLDNGVGSKLASYMNDAGALTSINETIYKLPFVVTADMASAEVRQKSMEKNLASNEALVKRVSGSRRSEEEIQKMLEDMEAEFHKLKPGDHSRMFVVVGQKL